MLIKQVSNNKRCEVCHQIDLYNDVEDFCSRCNNATNINKFDTVKWDNRNINTIKKEFLVQPIDKTHICECDWMPELSKIILRVMNYSGVEQRINRSTTCQDVYRESYNANDPDFVYDANSLVKHILNDWTITQDVNIKDLNAQHVGDDLQYLCLLGYIRSYRNTTINRIHFYSHDFIITPKGADKGSEFNSFGFKFKKDISLKEAADVLYHPHVGIRARSW